MTTQGLCYNVLPAVLWHQGTTLHSQQIWTVTAGRTDPTAGLTQGLQRVSMVGDSRMIVTSLPETRKEEDRDGEGKVSRYGGADG